jgi:hypothetical protein
MSLASLSDQRVGVLREPYSFVVTVDTQPVLRCTVRRDAFRYAVLVRRALRQADSIGASAGSLSPKRRLRPRGKIRH